MEFLGYLLALAAIWFIVSKILSEIKAGDGKHCLTCGTDGLRVQRKFRIHGKERLEPVAGP